MILRDLPVPQLIKLWHEGRVRWNSYTIEWVPNKWFTIWCGKRRVRIQDTFGFFQSSFVKSLDKWGFDPPAEIAEMKERRSRFSASMKRRIIDYCIEECRLLVALMDDVEQALDDVNVRLSSWVGAGSIASGLMNREKVKSHLVRDDEFPQEVQEALLTGYYGGRTELFLQGNFDRLWDYDISSAYPAAAINLPSLRDGQWKHITTYDPKHRHGLWLCRWNLPRNTTVTPFPFRRGTDIYYPYCGQGWYHAIEVQQAKLTHPGKITVVEGWVFEPATDERPFAFLPAIYEQRKKLKADGHGGEKVLKLGMNAIYGKLAQGYGYKGKPPPFQSYFWAGEITAATRARILSAARNAPNDLVMVATDGIFFRSEQDIALQPGLGGMELTLMDNVFVAQPGVYQATVDGEIFGRSRGFFSREIDFQDLREGFSRDGAEYIGRYEAERFIGLGTSLMSKLEGWRGWKTTTRKLSLYPSRKFLENLSTPLPENGSVRHFPPTLEGDGMPDPYTPKKGNVKLSDDDLALMVEYVQGTEQPYPDE